MTALKTDSSATTQPVSGSVTVSQATAANLKVDLSGTAANATAIKVDGSAVTQPVSGTVTANIGTSGSLALDATLTGGTQQTKLTDGTNIVNVLKSDGTAAGQNAQLVAPAYKEVGSLTAGALNADLVPSTDVSGYSTFALQIAGTFSGTLTLQGSNDNTNFTPVYGTWANNSQPVSVMTNTGIISGSCNFRYFRVRMTAYTSGTATGTLELKTMPFAPTNIQVSGTVTTTPVTVKNTGNITTSSSSILSTSGTGFSWALVTIHGTYSGIKFGITASDDGNTTYYNVPIWDVQNNKYIAPGSTISPADNSSASFIVPQSSNGSIVRVLATAYTSGTGAVAISGQSNSPAILSTEVNNSAVAGVGMQTASNSILNTLTAIKASGTNTPSTLYGWYFFNNNSTVAYCQIFDVSSTGSATLGTTAPTMSFGIPAFGGANAFPTQGIKFSNGIVIAMTTTRAGSTAPTTSVDYNIFYQ